MTPEKKEAPERIALTNPKVEVLDDLPLEEEVRQLLLTTRRQVLPSGPCWCICYLPYLGHTQDCLLSRALLQRLDQEKQ